MNKTVPILPKPSTVVLDLLLARLTFVENKYIARVDALALMSSL